MKNINFSGLTLVEMLLSLTLSMMILSGITTIFLMAQKSYQTQNALSNIQENAHMATEILSSDFRMAGYIGCAKLTNNFPLQNHTPFEFTQKNKIISHANAIVVRHASVSHAVLVKTMIGSSTLYTTVTPRFAENDLVIISDCKTAEIFQIKNVMYVNGLQKIITKQPLTVLFERNAEISQFEINTYYIAKTQRKHGDGSPVFALYVKHINHPGSEIVEDIERMKVNLDIEDNGVLQENAIEDVMDSQNVTGVAITLTLATADHIYKPWSFFIALR